MSVEPVGIDVTGRFLTSGKVGECRECVMVFTVTYPVNRMYRFTFLTSNGMTFQANIVLYAFFSNAYHMLSGDYFKSYKRVEMSN